MSGEGGRTLTIAAAQDAVRERLDVYLSRKLTRHLSRSRVRALVEEGNILLNGEKTRASARLRPGDLVQVTLPPAKKWDVAAEDIPLDIVYEDDDMLVVNKPRGMVVHPAAGHWEGTLVNAVLAHCPGLKGVGGEVRPGIVHRLDKDTSGLIVIAKHEKALRCLQEQIRDRKVERRYVALLRGPLRETRGTVDAPIGRHPVNRKKMAVVPTGRPALTEYRVLTRFGVEYTLVLARLRTGRTHQIRVHCAHVGHPVAGDPVYSRGRGELGLEGQALHAARLGLHKPSDGEYVELSAPLPSDFKSALDVLKMKYGEELPGWLS